jgi:hypothetical protein
MSKPLPPPSKARKDGKRRPSSPAPTGVVQALSEDGAHTAHADATALPASNPPAPSQSSDLEGIPFLGETRREALRASGLKTRDDLRGATVEQIGGVKGVGMVNAARVKDWLAAQPQTSERAEDNPDMALASANQDVQDVFQKLGDARARLSRALPDKTRDKGLDRQLDKLDTVASELAEGPDTLTAKQVQEAVKTLDKIAAFLENASKSEKLSPKKQADLIEELRTRRKRLQKTLGE